jgi:Tfp pilus assembly protein PilN
MDMIQINLLPKEYRKRTGKMAIGKAGYYAIGAAVGVIAMVAVITMYQMLQLRELDKKMEIARFRTQQLQKDIAVVDALIDVKGKLMQRMDAVDRLDRHRMVWVRIMEDISRRVPDFMWMSLFEEQAKPAPPAAPTDSTAAPVVVVQLETRPVKIEGFAFTLNALASFMIKMMRSDYFSDIELTLVEEVQIHKQKAYNYKVAATLHYLSDKELKELLAKETGSDLLASF